MKIGVSSHFKKSARKLSNEERKNLDERVGWLSKDVYNPKLKTHALTGKLRGQFSFSISYKKRVIFVFASENEVILIDVGSHDDVY